jgi:hypothetical protein
MFGVAVTPAAQNAAGDEAEIREERGTRLIFCVQLMLCREHNAAMVGFKAMFRHAVEDRFQARRKQQGRPHGAQARPAAGKRRVESRKKAARSSLFAISDEAQCSVDLRFRSSNSVTD